MTTPRIVSTAAALLLAACGSAAQTDHTLAACKAAVTAVENGVSARTQNYTGSDYRENGKVQLYLATEAADAGDADGCWRHYNSSTMTIK